MAGVMHGFFSLVEYLPEAAIGNASVVRALREHFLPFQPVPYGGPVS
jgi:hypothetical protein